VKICVVQLAKRSLDKDYPSLLVQKVLQRKQTDLDKWSALVAYQYCDNSVVEKSQLLEFVKACLKHNPKEVESKIRRRALKVLLLRVETEVALVSINHNITCLNRKSADISLTTRTRACASPSFVF